MVTAVMAGITALVLEVVIVAPMLVVSTEGLPVDVLGAVLEAVLAPPVTHFLVGAGLMELIITVVAVVGAQEHLGVADPFMALAPEVLPALAAAALAALAAQVVLIPVLLDSAQQLHAQGVAVEAALFGTLPVAVAEVRAEGLYRKRAIQVTQEIPVVLQTVLHTIALPSQVIQGIQLQFLLADK